MKIPNFSQLKGGLVAAAAALATAAALAQAVACNVPGGERYCVLSGAAVETLEGVGEAVEGVEVE